jgi:hypothetical protein
MEQVALEPLIVIVWVQLLVLPEESVAIQVRVIEPELVTSLYEIIMPFVPPHGEIVCPAFKRPGDAFVGPVQAKKSNKLLPVPINCSDWFAGGSGLSSKTPMFTEVILLATPISAVMIPS